MLVPKAHKLPSGTWYIQLRLAGESIYITAPTERECTHKAELAKAEHKNGLRERRAAADDPTLSQAIDYYCEDKRAALSPETARKYKNIKDNHWPELMERRLSKITPRQWQQAASAMRARYAYKTVSVSVGMVKTVVDYFKFPFPKLSLGIDFDEALDEDAKFLEPEQVLLFVEAARKSKYAVPLLLALSGLRIAEIDGLTWENVGPNYVKIRQVKIRDENNKTVIKQGAKTQGSVRTVDILIPALQEAIDAERKPTGKVMTCAQQTLRRHCAKVCRAAGVPEITVHQLRHSAASLFAYIGVPSEVAQSIGGWQNDAVMKKVYTHVAQSTITQSKTRITAFYAAKKNAT